MKNWMKKGLSLLLAVLMVCSMLPVNAFAEETAQSTGDDFYRILHLDCGRKFYTRDWIIALLNEMAPAGYNQLQLAFGNKGLRFLLDDMSVGSYTSEAVTAAVQAGNKAYYDAGAVNELTEADMDEIIAHANGLGIEIVPLMNTPFHSEALITAMTGLGMTDVYYGDNQACLNLSNDDVTAFVQELMGKYMDFFAQAGCDYFNFGADEYTGGWNDELYAYANAVSDSIVDAGMTPRCFNDSFRSDDNGSFKLTNAPQVCYWYTGYDGNLYAGAAAVQNAGYELINTNKDYYYVVSENQITEYDSDAVQYVFSGPYNESQWLSHASTFSNTKYNNYNTSAGNGSYTGMPAGSMFCVWSDDPGAKTETEIASEIRMILRVMGARMQDSTDYSTEVVDGGFNADGTIATKVENGRIAVSAPGLTGLEVADVTESAVFTAEGYDLYKAFDITPLVDGAAYTGAGTVTISGLNSGTYYVLDEDYLAQGPYTVTKGTLTFAAEHFSTYYVAAAAVDFDEVVNLTVNQTSGSYTFTGTGESGGDAIASWTVNNAETVDKFTFVTSYDPGKQYLIVNSWGRLLTNIAATHSSGTAGLQNVPVTVEATITGDYTDYLWTFEQNSNYYRLKNAASNQYMTVGSYTGSNQTLSLGSSATNLSLYDNGNGQFNIYSTARSGRNTYYCLLDSYAENFTAVYPGNRNANNYNNIWYLYEYTPEEGDPAVTFAGLTPGTTYATVGDTVFQINVSKLAATQNKSVVIGSSLDLASDIPADVAALGDISYTLVEDGEGAVSLNGSTVHGLADGSAVVNATVTNENGVVMAEYTFQIRSTEIDLEAVEKVDISMWVTNTPVDVTGWTLDVDYYHDTEKYTQLSASYPGVYSEAGIALYDILPGGMEAEGTAPCWNGELYDLRYWKTSMNTSDHRAVAVPWGNESLSGTDFTYIRYWNNSWAYSVDGTAWVAFDASDISSTDDTKGQINLWFHQITEITKEVSTLVVDWGPVTVSKGQEVLSFAVKYEDGGITYAEQSMGFDNGTDVEEYVFTDDGIKVRVIHGISAKEKLAVGYEVYMITLTPNSDTTSTQLTSTNYSSINAGTDHAEIYQGTEKAVWLLEEGLLPENMEVCTEEDVISHYTACVIGGAPYVEKIDIYENQGVLVTYYVRAKEVETNTMLNVVWWDDEANTAISAAPMTISVQGVDKTFATELQGNDAPVVLGAGLVLDDDAYVTNAAGNDQYIDKNLLNLVVSNGKYKSGAYTYVNAEVSEDGLTLTLHYNLREGITYDPMYVVDFGLPLSFDISDMLGSYGSVTSVAINNYGSFGRLTCSGNQTFTYEPTGVMTSTDIITVTIVYRELYATQETTVTKTIAFAPATTVYYEANDTFFDYDAAVWQSNTVASKSQEASAYHEYELVDSTDYNYGYDAVYANAGYDTLEILSGRESETINGGPVTFTFTGNGFDLYANANTGSGILYVFLHEGSDATGAVKKLYAVNTVMKGGTNDLTSELPAQGCSMPAVSVDDLAHGTYTLRILQLKGDNTIAGVRVYETIDTASGNIFDAYTSALEENPSFLELRNAVLGVVLEEVDLSGATYKKYYTLSEDGTIASSDTQILQTSDDVNAYLSYVKDYVDAETTAADILDLLENGPKNELYLYPGMKVTFKLSAEAAARYSQIGLRSLTGAAVSYTMTGKSGTQSISSTVDMFYPVALNKSGAYTVTIENTGSTGVLAITKIKVADAPAQILAPMVGADFEEPVIEYADAALTVTVNGASTTLTANGVVGESAIFSAADIQAAAEALVPEGYVLTAAFEDVTVAYGQEAAVTFTAEEIPTFTPERFEVRCSSSTVTVGRRTTLTVKTSGDVDSVLVDGKEITTYREVAELSFVGFRLTITRCRVFTTTLVETEVGAYTYDVVAVNADGVKSDSVPVTVNFVESRW